MSEVQAVCTKSPEKALLKIEELVLRLGSNAYLTTPSADIQMGAEAKVGANTVERPLLLGFLHGVTKLRPLFDGF